MSRTPHEAINVSNPGFVTGDYQYPPESAQNQGPHGLSNFVDGSGPIFSMYLEMASEEDKKNAENWKADADGILIFTGLFSAARASLISVSVQDIRPDPQNTSNFYLANIYGAISDPNRSNISNPLPSPPTFSPPTYAIWVNALWFLSLVISLTCALLATLLQQWARRYLKVTQPRYSPHKRARIRAFFAEGVDKFFLPWAVEVLPTLLHVSLFLFFAGLAVFLCNVNFTIFKLVIVWVIACTVIYACGTIIPIFRHDSPYHTPLLLAAWSIVTGMSLVAFRALRRLTFNYFGGEGYSFFRHLEGKCLKLLEQGMQKTAEGTALSLPSDIDTHAFLWTFDSLDEDHELERFFSGLPGFRNSKVVDDPLPHLNLEQLERLSTALIGFFDRSSSSDLLPEAVKRRRAIICAKAIDSLYTPKTLVILDRILFDYRQSSLLNEIVRIVRGWGNIDKDSIPFAEATVCRILASMKQRDDPWFIFASNELGVPEAVLRDYARHGDSLSLSVLTHITRQQFNHFCEQWPREAFSQVLQAASQFNVQDTSPVLQHEFCTLWNQIVLNVQKDNNPWVAGLLLGRIRNVYIALHHDTNATPTRFSASTSDYDEILSDPSSYPLCNLLCHHPDSTPHIHDNSASTSNSRAVPHDGATPAPASLSNPDAPFSPTQSPSPLPIANSVTDVPPLDNDINIPGSSHAHQTAIENLSTTSQDPFTARISEGGSDTSTTTTVPSTPELSLSTPPTSMASPSPPYDVSIQQIADCRSSLDALDIPSLPSPTALLDNLPHTESHSSLLVLTSPAPSHPHICSAVESGTAGEGEGNMKPGLSDSIVTPDLRPHSPSPTLSPIADISVSIPDHSRLYPKHTGGPPPQPSYDIV